MATWETKTVYGAEGEAGDDGRWVRHAATGFTVDVLRMAGPPSAFLWVTSPPQSDKGEAHCGEHVLLGKGAAGRSVATAYNLMGAVSSAQTHPLRTAYHVHVPTAEPGPLLQLVRLQLEALLCPDCTDDEITREVYDVSVDDAGELVETGAVYNEMQGSYEGPANRTFAVVRALLFGEDHPLAFEAGGEPGALRGFAPSDFRLFHRSAYQLHKMGAVITIPRGADETVEALLAGLDEVLSGLPTAGSDADHAAGGDPLALDDGLGLPAFAPHPDSATVRLVDYPCADEERETSYAVFAFPPTREHLICPSYGPEVTAALREALPAPDCLPADTSGALTSYVELTLLSHFNNAAASGSSSELYRALADSQQRELPTSATGTSAWTDSYPGLPIYFCVWGLGRDELTESGVDRLRAKTLEVLARIAAWAPGDPRLAKFNERVDAAAVASERSLKRTVDDPSGFGKRGTGDDWLEFVRAIHRLDRCEPKPAQRYPLNCAPCGRLVRAVLDAHPSDTHNVWAALLRKWRMLGEDQPFAIAAVPSKALQQAVAAQRDERLAAFKAALPDQDVAAYAARRALVTKELERQAQADPPVEGVQRSFPLSSDEELQYAFEPLYDSAAPGRVDGTLCVAQVPRVSLAVLSLKLQLPPPDLGDPDALVIADLMNDLHQRVGYRIDGVDRSHIEVRELLQREVYAVTSGYGDDVANGRHELSVRVSVTDVGELDRALVWMEAILTSPLWQPSSLPRMRDVLASSIDGLRSPLSGRAEYWAGGVIDTIMWQDQPHLLAGSSFALLHSTMRCKWLLEDPPTPLEAFRVRRQVAALAACGADREKQRALPLHDDLTLLLANTSDPLLVAKDAQYACAQMLSDRQQAPADVLARMRRRLAQARLLPARGYVLSSVEDSPRVAAELRALAARLSRPSCSEEEEQDVRAMYARLHPRPVGSARVVEHAAGGTGRGDVVAVALVNEESEAAVVKLHVPAPDIFCTSRDALLDHLSAMQMSGSGAHSVFMRVWQAGLAYSSGISSGTGERQASFYADQCPDVVATLDFVRRVVASVEGSADYAVAQAFAGSLLASPYESRIRAAAGTALSGVPRERQREWRRAVLALRAELGDDELVRQLRERARQRFDAILTPLPAAQRFDRKQEVVLIANSKHVDRFEQRYGPVLRLRQRDFWQRGDAQVRSAARARVAVAVAVFASAVYLVPW